MPRACFNLVLVGFLGTVAAADETGVTVYPAPKGAPVSRDYAVTAGGKSVDVYAVNSARFAYCDIAAPVEVTVTAQFISAENVRGMSIHPLSMKLRGTRSGNKLTFRVEQPVNLTILINGRHRDRALHLFLNPPAPPVPENAVFFKPGIHKLDPTKPVTLFSGQTLYIAGGAWVEGIVTIRKADNITITGRGVLFPTLTSPVNLRRGLRIYDSKNVKISGIVIARTRGPGWCCQITNCDNVAVSNFHVIAPAIPSTDGINPCNSRNVTIEDSFFRTGDDCVAIKGNTAGPVKTSHNIDPGTQPPVENITVRRCQFWSEFNNVLCIGAETWAKHFDKILFDDCDILYHGSTRSGTISILACQGAPIRNITYSNIRVEYTISQLFMFNIQARMYGIPGNHTFPGDITDITIRNIHVLHQAGGPRSIFASREKNKHVRNVSIQGVRYGNTLMRNAEQMGLECGPNVSNVRFAEMPEETARQKMCLKPDFAKGPIWLTFESGFHAGKGGDRSNGVWIKIAAREEGAENYHTLLDVPEHPQKEWQPRAVNLSRFAGKKLAVRVSVAPGPDTSYDWFQVALPQIIRITGKKTHVLMDLETLWKGADKGILGFPYGDAMPLDHGAVVRPRLTQKSSDRPVVGGVSKPGIILHPAWKDGYAGPVFLEWTVDLTGE